MEEMDELRSSNIVVTTLPSDISEFLSKKGKKVIFSTYLSIGKIEEAVQKSGHAFELGIFDEAHHVAGHIEKQASKVLRDDVIQSKKRVFLTATPRVASNSTRGDDNWLGMENKDHFGSVAYTLPFRKAVKDKILTDYRLVVTVVDKAIAESLNVGSTFEENVALVATVLAAA